MHRCLQFDSDLVGSDGRVALHRIMARLRACEDPDAQNSVNRSPFRDGNIFDSSGVDREITAERSGQSTDSSEPGAIAESDFRG
jgi:hypothetical protein